MKRVVAVLLALIFAYWGQRLFANDAPLLDALILYAVAAFFLTRVPPRVQAAVVPSPSQTKDKSLAHPDGRNQALTGAGESASRWGWLRRRGHRRVTKGLILLIIGAVVLVSLASRILVRQGGSNEALILWVLGLLCFIYSFWRISSGLATGMDRRELVILAGIMLIALFMRAYRLGEMPPAVYLDEADNGIWGLRFVSEPYSPFTPNRDSNAALFYQILGLSLKAFGVRVLTMRWQDVVIGLLTVLAFYFLARELYGVAAAQGATFLLAVSRWHTNFSRIAFVEIVPVPLFEILIVLFLWRGMERGRRSDFAWAGLLFGLGFHTYIGYRVFPAVLALLVLHQLLIDRASDWPGRQWLNLLVFGLATFMTLAPLGVYALKQPDVFMRRVKAASVAQDIERAGSYEPVRANLKKSLLMFNYRGDPRPRHNLPHEPMLDFGTAILFGLGVGYSLRYFRHSRYFLPVMWLLIGLLPSILSLADSNPHSSRTLGNVGPVFLLTAVTWDRMRLALLKGLEGKGYRLLVGVAVAGLLLIGRSNYQTYFYKQAGNESVYYDFDPIQTSVGEAIKANGYDHRVFVSSDFANHSAVKFIPYGVPYQVFDLNAHLPIREQLDQDALFILERNHAPFVTRLQQLYPRGIYHEVDDRYGRLMYYTFLVPRDEVAAIQGLKGSYYASAEPEGEPVLQRKDATISFDWSTARPGFISGPEALFSGTWEGSLYVPRFGNYVFILDTDGSAQLWLDEELVVESSGERAQGTIQLPAGFHAVALNAAQQHTSGWLTLNWIPAGSPGEQVVPQTALYTAHLARQGLLGRYYRGTNWSGGPVSIQLDAFIAPNDVIPSPFSIQWEGRIYAPTTGNYVFGTNSDDGSLLYIDGQLVVDNGGHHGDRYVEGRITLEEGFHDIILRYFQDGGGRKIELWWTPPGRGKEQVPAEFLSPPSERLPEPPTLVPPQIVQVPEGPVPEAGPIGQVRYVSMWGGQGTEPGQFQGPRGIAVDRQRGQVYVVDTGNKRVQVFGLDGSLIAVWDRGDEPFEEPFDVVVDSQGEVYVLDAVAQFIQRYGPSGELHGAIGHDLAFYRPRGLAIDTEDNLYVADTGGNRIVKITPSGQQLAQFGGQGAGPGQVSQPTDVAVDASGRMYVVDSYNLRVQVLDPAGRYLREWPIGGANTFDSPHIELGPGGQVFVTDPEAHKVIAYDGAGRPLGEWGGFGQEAGRFQKPISLAFDGTGRAYVTDAYNHRVQVFELGPPE